MKKLLLPAALILGMATATFATTYECDAADCTVTDMSTGVTTPFKKGEKFYPGPGNFKLSVGWKLVAPK